MQLRWRGAGELSASVNEKLFDTYWLHRQDESPTIRLQLHVRLPKAITPMPTLSLTRRWVP